MKKLLNREVISYLIFGVLTTLVNFLVYAGLQKSTAAPLFVINIIAWFISVVFAYITNKIFVFESKSWRISVLAKEASLFFGARLLSGVVEMGGFPILYGIGLDQPLFGIDGFLAKVIISVFVIILNYVFSKLLIFRNKEIKS